MTYDLDRAFCYYHTSVLGVYLRILSHRKLADRVLVACLCYNSSELCRLYFRWEIAKFRVFRAGFLTGLSTLKGLQDVPEWGSILDLEISDDIMAISQSGKFFATLASIKTEKDFGGTLHCEAFLASLLDETANVSKGLVAQMKVGYFSSSFLSPDSFLVKGSGNNYWNIKMLLPNMPTTARPPGEKQTSASQVYCKRRSQYHYSLHSAHMASGAYRGFNERAFWGPFETGAYSIHRPLRNIASSCWVQWFTQTFFCQRCPGQW